MHDPQSSGNRESCDHEKNCSEREEEEEEVEGGGGRWGRRRSRRREVVEKVEEACSGELCAA